MAIETLPFAEGGFYAVSSSGVVAFVTFLLFQQGFVFGRPAEGCPCAAKRGVSGKYVVPA